MVCLFRGMSKTACSHKSKCTLIPSAFTKLCSDYKELLTQIGCALFSRDKVRVHFVNDEMYSWLGILEHEWYHLCPTIFLLRLRWLTLFWLTRTKPFILIPDIRLCYTSSRQPLTKGTKINLIWLGWSVFGLRQSRTDLRPVDYAAKCIKLLSVDWVV